MTLQMDKLKQMAAEKVAEEVKKEMMEKVRQWDSSTLPLGRFQAPFPSRPVAHPAPLL